MILNAAPDDRTPQVKVLLPPAETLLGAVTVALTSPVVQNTDASSIDPRIIILTGQAAQWRKGKLPLETIFNDPAFTADDALKMLYTPGVLTNWHDDKLLRQGLMEWLQQHAPQSLAAPEKLPTPVQLALAEYYNNRKDPRAEKIYQECIAGNFLAGVWWSRIQALYDLADFYGSRGEYLKAAQTKLAIQKYSTEETWIANTDVEAARYYTQAGETATANALYQKAEKSPYGWAAGVALYDHGRALIEQRKYDEAIKVLSTPVTGQFADQAQIGLTTLLGYCYYREGKFDLAKQYSQQALDQYNALANPLQHEGIEGSLDTAHEVIEWIPKWMQSPIICGPNHLDVVFDDEDKRAGTISRQMEVRTIQSTSFQVRSNNPMVKAHVKTSQQMESDNPFLLNYYNQSKLVVEIAPQAAVKGLDASLVVQSPEFPDFTVQIPIHVEKVVLPITQ